MSYNKMVEVSGHLYHNLVEMVYWLTNKYLEFRHYLTTMGKSHNINTYSDELVDNMDTYGYEVKNVKRGKKKKVAKHKQYEKWEEDSY